MTRTECMYGYGFYVFVSNANMRYFLKKHEETLKKLSSGQTVLKYMETHPGETWNINEDLCNYESEATGESGIYGVIADIMCFETGIDFEYHNTPDPNEDNVILLPMVMPWQYNETEKALTLEKLEDICNRYVLELNPALKFDDIRVEYND